MKLRKLFAAGLALVMTLAMAAPAFATGTASITINPNNGTGTAGAESYTAYKIFDATFEGDTIGKGDNASYTITSDSKFFATIQKFANDSATPKYFTLTQVNGSTTYVVTPTDAYKTEEAAIKLADELNKVSDKGTGITVDAVAGKVEFTGLDKGYYMVVSSLGSKLVVETLGQVTINEKNGYPTLTKTADKPTASYGETVTFTIAVTIPDTAEGEIVVHDVLPGAFTYGTLTNSNATKSDTACGTDGCNLEFVINAATVKANLGKTVNVIYTATLNAGVDTDREHTNTAWLTYSQYTSAKATASVKTFEFDLVKTDKDAKLLTGAQFKLYDAATGGNEIKVVKNADGIYRVAVDGETGVVIEAGNVTIKGLGNGTYYLEETVAPQGYNPLTELVEVVVTNGNNKATVTEGVWISGGVRVVNQTGLVLPSTGGMGTTLFYIVGGLMVVCAGVVLVTKKRMGNK